MLNPFKYLDDRQPRNGNANSRKLEELTKSSLQEEQRVQARFRAAQQYDEMVMKVLEQLRATAYPDCLVRNHRIEPWNDGGSEPCWSIGSAFSEYDAHGVPAGVSTWGAVVIVTVIFDHLERPTVFECARKGHYGTKSWFGDQYVLLGDLKCSLQEKELVRALIQLHPAREVV